MLIFLLGIILFFGVHILPFYPEVRRTVITQLDRTAFEPEPIYKLLFAIVSVIGILCIAIGKGAPGTMTLWSEPGNGLRAVVALFILLAFTLLVASKMPNNIKRYVPHPMLTGILIWSVCHMIVNGDLTSFFLFALFAIYSVVAIVLSNKRDKDQEKQPSEIVPIAKDGITIGIALLIFLLLLWLHGPLFSRAVFL